MKFNIILKCAAVISVATLGLIACNKKYPGDSYDFSDTSEKYIRLTAGAITINGSTVDTTIIDGTDTTECYYHIPDAGPAIVRAETREGLPNAVHYTIEYKSPTKTATLNGIHPKLTLSSPTSFTVEDSEFTEDEIRGTLTLKTATGYDLRIGYPAVGAGTTVNFVAYKPYVIHEY